MNGKYLTEEGPRTEMSQYIFDDIFTARKFMNNSFIRSNEPLQNGDILMHNTKNCGNKKLS